MGKDTHLVNIYLRIHNKQPLTLDDLRYLAQYAPDCFEKTCKNVVYNIPETKPLMEPTNREATAMEATDKEPASQLSDLQNIEEVLKNIKRLETNDFPVINVDAEEVKNLLGNLYMELLFPHNDKDMFINFPGSENTSSFDKKA